MRDPGEQPLTQCGHRGAASSRGNSPSLRGHGAPPPGRATCRRHREAQPCPPGTDIAVRTARRQEKPSTRRRTGQGEAAEGRQEHRQRLLAPNGRLRPKRLPQLHQKTARFESKLSMTRNRNVGRGVGPVPPWSPVHPPPSPSAPPNSTGNPASSTSNAPRPSSSTSTGRPPRPSPRQCP